MMVLFTEEMLSEKRYKLYVLYNSYIKILYILYTHIYILHEYSLYTVTHTCTHTH